VARDVDELLAAYALDALDDEERREVEAVLATSPEAREQLREHLETIARLHDDEMTAPPQIWDAIRDRIDGEAREDPCTDG
jgi:anti-sigma factor RsiW